MHEAVSMEQSISALRFREIKPVIESFDFPYAVLKGEPLSVMAYGKLGQRKSGDIDILLAKENISKATAILERYNFKPTNTCREREIFMHSFSHQITPYGKKTGLLYTEIDINHDIFWGEYKGRKIAIDDFLSDVIEISVYNYKVLSLTPIKAFIQLALHQYRDMNSIYLLALRKKIKISPFLDIYFLLKNNVHTIPVDELYEICERFCIIPYVYYVLYHVNTIFPDLMLKSYVQAFETDVGLELLGCYGLSSEERKNWRYDLQTRLNSNDIFQLICDDLTDRDMAKIEYNKKMLL